MATKRPDYRIVVKKKDEKFWSQVGVGWSNEFGGINIKLNPFVTLTDKTGFYIAVRPLRGTLEEGAVYDQEPPIPADDDVPF